MNLTDELRAVKSGEKDLRNFGFLLGGVLAGISLFPVLAGRGISLPWFLAGITLTFLGLAYPRLLWPFQRIWMAAGILLGMVVTNIILTVFFFAALLPLALTLRLFRKRPFDPAFRLPGRSYWHRRPPSSGASGLEKQF